MKENFTIAGITAKSGERVQKKLPVPGTDTFLPVTVINGAEEGKTVLITSAIHGCEYPSIEAVFRLAEGIDPAVVSGQIVVINPVNADAFFQRRPYVVVQDGKNLNRLFPPVKEGTVGDRIAYMLSEEFIKKADFYIDTHGGDIPETQPNYVYYPGISEDEEVLRICKEASEYVLHTDYRIQSHARNHAYTHAAIVSTPSLELELGQNGSWTEEEVRAYTENIYNLLKYLQVYPGEAVKKEPPVHNITQAAYIDAEFAGRWYPSVRSNEKIRKGDKIGEIRDLFGNVLVSYYAEYDANILMIATSLAVNKEDALFAYGC